ncbi:MAG: hypothetical protein QJR13_02265 [Bacillota bacterium]|nr:hypothetical protein [Bacillota bacterium]
MRRILSAYIAAAARKEEEDRLADIAGIACDLQLAGRAHDSLLYPEGNR